MNDATLIILAGGRSRRMPGDKALMEVGGRSVIDIQLEVTAGLFEETLLVVNEGRVGALARYEERGVRVLEETVRGMGPLGGIASGLELSKTRENFVLACDMPFIRREAVAFVLGCLPGYQVAVPRTSAGLEPLHAAYNRECLGAIQKQLELGDLRVTGFYHEVRVRFVEWEEIAPFDPTSRFLLNMNSPEDVRRASAVLEDGEALSG
ncbi:MAG: molybdenum cofactor guanylyltransferase [Actinomycetota bacterium]